MRVLFLFLVLLNLGYMVWEWQQQGEPRQLPSGPLAVAPGAKTLTLLSELPPGAAQATPTPPPADAAQDTLPEPLPAETP